MFWNKATVLGPAFLSPTLLPRMVLAALPKMMAVCVSLACVAPSVRRPQELALLDIEEDVEISANKKILSLMT